MPGGKYDSSKTRVAPVFTRLRERTDDWVRQLLTLPRDGPPTARAGADVDLRFEEGYWGDSELGIPPAPSLLDWLVRNPSRLRLSSSSNPARQSLLANDPVALQEALAGLQSQPTARAWYVLEGVTFPDAALMTPDAIVVVEGKRTESGPTVDTKWLAGRHQIWRHIEAAWEMRGTREVYGLFIVEGDAGGIPAIWNQASRETFSDSTLKSSFPHRTTQERAAIARCFLGVTTWQEVCGTFGIDFSELPRTTDDA